MTVRDICYREDRKVGEIKCNIHIFESQSEATFQLLVVQCWSEWAMGADYLVSNPGFSINQQWGLWQTGKHSLILNLYSSYRTSEMSWWVKVLTFKSDDLSITTKTHMVVRTISWKSYDIHTCAPMGPHTCTHTKISKLIKCNFRKFLIIIITVALSKGCDN